MTPTRKRRLIAIVLILAAVAIAAGLIAYTLGMNMQYLYSPSEALAHLYSPSEQQATPSLRAHTFKLGGIVLEHSIERDPNSLKVDFVITDRFKQIPVEYTGILPDLFREGQSVIATGQMQGDRFVASEVLAKHDESYMPKEVADAIAKAKAAHAAQAKP